MTKYQGREGRKKEKELKLNAVLNDKEFMKWLGSDFANMPTNFTNLGLKRKERK